MGKIKILPLHEAQKIAAGEVVERPANIVKELIENALDAGATTISLYIEDGGRERVVIIDNGCGMSLEDARLSIVNHATSKISCFEDLVSVDSFGFRGEALASIAAVSHCTLTTKEAGKDQGHCLRVEAGSIVSEDIAACNSGTSIDISNIFYNVPARKKFLKKRETEWNALYQVVVAFCLQNLSCTFTVHHDKKQVMHCPAVNDIAERFAQVFDSSLACHTIVCDSLQKDGIHVWGAITNHTYSRYDRSHIFTFVNRRCVKNYKLVQAIIKGYSGILQPNRYPCACLFITLDPLQVDHNVHPRKEEVEFLHPRKVEAALEYAVHTALNNQLAHNLGLRSPVQDGNVPFSDTRSVLLKSSHYVPSFERPSVEYSDMPAPHYISKMAENDAAVYPENFSSTHKKEESEIVEQHVLYESTYDYQLIGQIHATYLMIQTRDGIVMIDQHAAHERILYEEFVRYDRNIPSSRLIFPQLIQFSEHDCAGIIDLITFFEKYGIVLEYFNATHIRVQALPVSLKNCNVEDSIRSLMKLFEDRSLVDGLGLEDLAIRFNDRIRTMMACKAAIKKGDILNDQQMHALIKKLYETPHKTTCPHGRPTCWPLTLTEIEKKFKRDYR